MGSLGAVPFLVNLGGPEVSADCCLLFSLKELRLTFCLLNAKLRIRWGCQEAP